MRTMDKNIALKFCKKDIDLISSAIEKKYKTLKDLDQKYNANCYKCTHKDDPEAKKIMEEIKNCALELYSETVIWHYTFIGLMPVFKAFDESNLYNGKVKAKSELIKKYAYEARQLCYKLCMFDDDSPERKDFQKLFIMQNQSQGL